MLKNVNSLSDLLNFDHQKKTFNSHVNTILKIIKEETDIDLEDKNIYIKNNIFKIKVSSNIKFVILLHLTQINQKIKTVYKDFILEL